jgi:signal transduction histidine kinase
VKLHRKLVVHYIKFLLVAAVLVFMSLMISVLYLNSVYKRIESNTGSLPDLLYPLILFTVMFLIPALTLIVFGFLYGKRMSVPIFYFLEWVDRLSQGNFVAPTPKRKKGKVYPSFHLYQELTHKMDRLTNRLKQNEIERKELENMRQEWTSGVTHDLKTPLSYILGYSTMLRSEQHKWTDAERDHFVQIIQDKAVHMQQLIDDLSDAFQFERGVIPLNEKRHDMITFIKEVVEDVKQQPTSLQQHIHFKTDEEKLVHTFDARLLKRAFMNFLMNAVLHNPPGTEIAVSVSVDRSVGHKQKLFITISDDGVGMTKKKQQDIFRQYYRGTTTDRSGDGTGLGMAIAKQFIEAHDGTIGVQSSPGQGTVVTVSLPLQTGQ